MPAPAGESNHLKRDARDAAFHEIAVELGKYRRRLVEAAYREVDNLLADAEGEISGTSLGHDAAARALAEFGVTTPRAALEATATAASLGA